MNVAVDKITGATVKADDAKSFKTYRCPECAAPVSIVDATLRIRHFSHRANTAKDGCPLYHEGGDASGVFKRKAFRRREPRLVLQTFYDRGQLRWQLQIVVPRLDEFSSFTLSQSPNAGRILMASVDQRGREFPVFPSRANYMLTLHASGAPSDTVSIDGLGELCLFRLSAAFGSRVEPTEQLSAGTAYVAVHNRRLNDVPPSVEVHWLANAGGWNACVLRFPQSISDVVRTWAARELNFSIRDVEPMAAIIWPPLVGQAPDGNWIVPITLPEPVVTVIQFSNSFGNRALLVHDDGSEPSGLSVTDSRNFLKIEQLTNGYHELRFSNSAPAPIRIVATPALRKPRCESVTFEILEHGQARIEPLWSKGLIQTFASVRSGSASLRGVAIPNGCAVELRTVSGGKETLRVFQGAIDNELLLQGLNLALRAADTKCEVNAGGFGNVSFPTIREQPTAPKRKNQTNGRTRWLCLAGFDRRACFAAAESPELYAHARQLGLLS